MASERSAQRLSRLLNLYALLSETNQPLTAKEIRERLAADYGPTEEAFRRNFERDKAELRALGIELHIEEVHRGGSQPEYGYRVPRGAKALRIPDLEEDELAALQLAASLVRLGGAEAAASGLWKVGAPGPVAADDGEELALPAHPQLGPLFRAVAERRTATFRYRGEARTVHPYRLELARGRWYLLAHDPARGEGDAGRRWFRLDRMEGEPAVGQQKGAFPPPEGPLEPLPEQWELAGDDPVTARVAFDEVAAPLARQVLGEAAVVEERDGGGVVVELQVSHRDGFRSFVLGFLEHAEVLSPPELRDELVAWLEVLAP